MARLIYNIAIGFYHLGIRLAAWFNPKAKAWVDGRKDNIQKLTSWREQWPTNTPVFWMHCASLGEFEQGRPVLEQIRKDFPYYKIVLTFYSPSGYEQRKNYDGADWVNYLPADGKKRAEQWLEILQPSLVVFVKYEFWIEHLTALFLAKIPTFLIAASFRSDQLFFKPYGSLYRKTLAGFQHIFTQSSNDLQLLKSIDIQTASVAGDPRVDRVVEIAASPNKFDTIADFKRKEKVLIAGSSWKPDETILLDNQAFWQKDWKLILVPHEVDEAHIQQITDNIKINYVRYSHIKTNADVKDKRILIIDTVGMLSQLYQYGDLAYIGGGFGVSIHNTLEPAAFHLPILFGPKYKKFPEAVAFVQDGGAFVINEQSDFEKYFTQLKEDKNRKNASAIIQQYMVENMGATTRIMGKLSDLL